LDDDERILLESTTSSLSLLSSLAAELDGGLNHSQDSGIKSTDSTSLNFNMLLSAASKFECGDENPVMDAQPACQVDQEPTNHKASDSAFIKSRHHLR